MIDLRNFFIFSKFSDEEFEEFLKISHIKKLQDGNILFYEGDKPEKLHLLLRGNIKVYRIDSKNKEIVIHNFETNQLIAELANLENIPYPATAESIGESEVLLIDYSKFRDNFLSNPKISLELIKSLTKKIKALESLITNLTLDSKSKVAKYIYDNEDSLINMKNIQISSTLNISPETLSRVITKLKQEKIIDKNGKILDKKSLKEIFS